MWSWVEEEAYTLIGCIILSLYYITDSEKVIEARRKKESKMESTANPTSWSKKRFSVLVWVFSCLKYMLQSVIAP